jgi:hypothetical protein
MPKEEKATPATNLSSKQFYIDALNKIQGNNVITTYTRDREQDDETKTIRKKRTSIYKKLTIVIASK